MADKVHKIRENIEKLKSQLLRGACSSQIAMETRCKEEAYNEVLAILDTMQEEPVSENKMTISKEWFEHCKKSWYNEGYIDGEYNRDRQFENSVSEDLGEYINELSKQFPEVSFAKLSRIAVRVAKWQREQMMAKAIDVEVKVEAGGYPYIPQMELYDYDKDVPLAKEGDRYKVILIKEG